MAEVEVTKTTTEKQSEGLGDKVMPTADGAGSVAEAMRDGLNEQANVETKTSVEETISTK